MSILDPPTPSVNPDPGNPRSTWPEWVDSDRWAPSDDEPRPSAGADYIPSADDDREAAEILNGDGPSDAELDARALDSLCLSAACSGLPWL